MFKSFDDFVPMNEGREKLVVIDHKTKVPNGEAAFKVKYIGQTFGRDVMEMYFKTNPKTKVIIDKMAANPEQYFVAFSTKKDGTDRAFSQNKTWVAFIELINNTKNGSPAYQGFNDVPYNGFVPYEDLEKLVVPSNGEIVNATKAAVDSIKAQNPGGGQDQGTPQPVPAPMPNPNQVPNADQINAENGQNNTQPEQNTGTTDIEPQYFAGLKYGDKSKKVQQLQRAIELITAKVSPPGLELAKKNISSKTKRYDGIWGPYTGKALALALGLFLPGQFDPNLEIKNIGQTELSALNEALKKLNITLNSLTGVTSSEEAAFKANGPVNPNANPVAKAQVKPGTINANSVASNNQAQNPVQNATPGSQSVDTTLGKIYFA